MNCQTKKWLWSVLLPTPLWILIALHFGSAAPGETPTGLMQLDDPFYAARVREVFDSGHMTAAVANPCSASYDSPKIYFQIHNLLTAILGRILHLSPASALLFFQVLTSILFARAAIALFEQVAGIKTVRDGLLATLFFWGGGVLCVLGIGVALLHGAGLREALFSAFQFEPDKIGWWSLNVGRNVATQYEAYFHAIFFLAILAMLQERFVLALIFAAILVGSHIITGVEVLAVLLGVWCVERWSGNRRIPVSFFVTALGLTLLHIGYHVVFLNRFPEHHLVTTQNMEAWLLQARSFVPAYALVAAMVAWQMRTSTLAREFLTSYTNRVLLVWAATCFLLANHEFAVNPMQPVHFDRGYIVAPLFLLGVGSLRSLMDWLSGLRNVSLRYLGVILLTGIFLFDNACWFSALGIERTVIRKNKGDFYLTHDQKAVLDWLNACPDKPRPVVVCEDLRLGYLVIAYTPLRSWASHDHETPDYHQHIKDIQALSESGTILPQWLTSPTLWIVPPTSPAESALIKSGATMRFETPSYKILSSPSS